MGMFGIACLQAVCGRAHREHWGMCTCRAGVWDLRDHQLPGDTSNVSYVQAGRLKV